VPDAAGAISSYDYDTSKTIHFSSAPAKAPELNKPVEEPGYSSEPKIYPFKIGFNRHF
jgi:hypothetical protein